MVDLNFEKERISFTPIILYTEYINLQTDYFLKENYKELDITPGDSTYLVNIFYHEKISQRELSDLLYVSEANVAQIIKRLEKKNFVERVVDENNKCRKLLSLTHKGKLTVYSLIKAIYDIESKLTSRYSHDEIELFKKMLYEISEESAEIIRNYK